MQKENLSNKFRKAALKFTKKIIEEKCVEAVVLTGSLVHNQVHPNSDVDIYIILNPQVGYRERGNLYIDGVEIEYFKNPPQQIRTYFQTEQHRPHTAHMLAFGEIIYSKSNMVDELIAEARKIIEIKRPALTPMQKELMKYRLGDLLKDLKDCVYSEDSVGYFVTQSKLIESIIDTLYHIDREFTPKNKWLDNSLKFNYPEVYMYLKNITVSSSLEIEPMEKLISIIENKLGGPRTRNWTLKTELTL